MNGKKRRKRQPEKKRAQEVNRGRKGEVTREKENREKREHKSNKIDRSPEAESRREICSSVCTRSQR